MAAQRIWKRKCRREFGACGFLLLQKALEETSTWGNATHVFYNDSIYWNYQLDGVTVGKPAWQLDGASCAETPVLCKCSVLLPQTIHFIETFASWAPPET